MLWILICQLLQVKDRIQLSKVNKCFHTTLHEPGTWTGELDFAQTKPTAQALQRLGCRQTPTTSLICSHGSSLAMWLEAFNLGNLTTLDTSQCQSLTMQELESLSTLPSLTTWTLCAGISNHYYSFPVALAPSLHLRQIRRLIWRGHWECDNSTALALSHLFPKLTALHITKADLSNLGFHFLGQCSDLTELDVSDSLHLPRGERWHFIGQQWPLLQSLTVRNYLSFAVPSEIHHLENSMFLHTLVVEDCSDGFHIPSLFLALNALPCLRIFKYKTKRHFPVTAFKSFAIPGLKELHLHNSPTHLSWKMFRILGRQAQLGLCNLQFLRVPFPRPFNSQGLLAATSLQKNLSNKLSIEYAS